MARAEVNLLVIAGSAATLAVSWAIIAAADTRGNDVALEEASAVDISTPPAMPVDLVSTALAGPVSAPLPVFETGLPTASEPELGATQLPSTNTAAGTTTELAPSPTPVSADAPVDATADPQAPTPNTTTDPPSAVDPVVEPDPEPEVAPAPEPTPEEDVVRTSKAS